VSALAAVLESLVCPHCGADLALEGARVRCAGGHTFDVARQGYVSLLAGARHPEGDSAEMVAARERFLAAGHFAPLEAAVAAAAATGAAGAVHATSAPAVAPPPGPVVELGAGTARYLAAALDRLPGRGGIAFDASAPALRRAARAHPAAAAVGADAWGTLPLRDGAAAVVLSVFAPRGGAELARVLAPGGALVVAAPTDRHLAELVGALGLVGIDPRKRERMAERLDPHLAPVSEATVEFALALGRDAVSDLVWMGPTARHADRAAMTAAIAALEEPVRATASVTVSVHRR
jgi:23S rRNA (guanine745-N1)-methyltransferase